MKAESAPSEPTVLVHVNLEVPVAALQAVVRNAKLAAGKNEKGHYRVDTADAVAQMISRFLAEKDFASFANEINNYRDEEDV